MTDLTFFAADEAVVIGYDSEFADYDNPRGAMIGFAGRVYAEDAQGNRWFHTVATDYDRKRVLNLAETMAERLTIRYQKGRLPVAFSGWTKGRPAYGSQAYQDYGADDDIAMERNED